MISPKPGRLQSSRQLHKRADRQGRSNVVTIFWIILFLSIFIHYNYPWQNGSESTCGDAVSKYITFALSHSLGWPLCRSFHSISDGHLHHCFWVHRLQVNPSIPHPSPLVGWLLGSVSPCLWYNVLLDAMDANRCYGYGLNPSQSILIFLHPMLADRHPLGHYAPAIVHWVQSQLFTFTLWSVTAPFVSWSRSNVSY
jgi:hypothetical protein